MTQITQPATHTQEENLHKSGANRSSRPQRGAGRGTFANGSTIPRRDGHGKRGTFPWINGQIIAAADTGDLHHLLATINAHLDQMNLVNLSTALHRLAKLSSNARTPSLQALPRQTLPMLLATVRQALARSEATGAVPKCQALSNITWALATMQVVDLPLLQMVIPRAQTQLADFKNFELCQLLWAFAKLGTVDPALCDSSAPLFEIAAEFVKRHIEEFSFRGLVMTSWAFATAKQHDRGMFRAIAEQLIPMVQGANCQELANTAWAFSTAGVPEDRLFGMLAHVAIPRVLAFKPQELSSILWSFASIGYNHSDFYEATGRAAMQMQLQAQQLANILWALTKMRPRHDSSREVLLRLLPSCTSLLGTFKTQELASVALAASKCFRTSPGSEEPHQAVPSQVAAFFCAALPLAVPNLREYSGQSLANIASSFLAVQIGNTGLFASVSYEIMSRAETLESSALLLLLKTLPQVPQSAPVHSAVCQLFAEAARRVERMPARELQVLARICARPCGASDAASGEGPPSTWLPNATWANREDLRVWCLTLATKWQSGDIIPSQAGAQDADLGATGTAGDADTEAAEDPGAAYDRWTAPITLTVANTGRPASAWDEKAMQRMRDAVQTSTAKREEEAREHGGDGHVDGPAWAAGSANREKISQQPHFVFSVKNTFLDVEQGNNPGDEGSDSELMQMPLAPALPFIPESVSAEKLQHYRANYARFRVGNAIGAKGELDTVS